ncbi:MAG: 3-phosphoshikimate 1-carboxyvinyltransferase, partial [Oscillospiraceae bacterium]|nr:3-phosphoshikimate 1-carboxyvinyltransferase [Oscillospiraceae bacterium]
MDVRIEPSKLFGTIKAIPSKSYAQRILTASALSDKPTEILLDYISDDVRSAINALISFGAEIKIETDKLIVTPAKKSNQINIDCGESGTVARL